LLVGTADGDTGKLFLASATLDAVVGVAHLDGNSLGSAHGLGVGEAQFQQNGPLVLLVDLGLVTETINHQTAFITLGDPFDHVGDKGAGETMHRTGQSLVTLAVDLDFAGPGIVDHLDQGVSVKLEGTLGALHLDLLAVHLHIHSGRKIHRLLADTRHEQPPSHIATRRNSGRISKATLK